LKEQLDESQKEHAPCSALIAALRAQLAQGSGDMDTLRTEVDVLRRAHAPCPNTILQGPRALPQYHHAIPSPNTITPQYHHAIPSRPNTITLLQTQVAALEKKHSPCADLIASLRDQLANLEKKMDEMNTPIIEDDYPILQFEQTKSRSVRAVRSAPPPPLTPKIIGVGMMIKVSSTKDSRIHGKMTVVGIAPGGGAFQCGQIELGDMVVGVASAPEEPIRIAKNLDEVCVGVCGCMCMYMCVCMCLRVCVCVCVCVLCAYCVCMCMCMSVWVWVCVIIL